MNVFPRNQFFGKLTRCRTAVGCAGLWILGWLAVSWPGESQAASFQDMFTNRETVTATSGRLDGDNSAASVELNEPRHGGKAGGHSLWISWVAPADGVATFVTDNNNFDTLLSAYYFNTTNDTTLDKLHEAARDDDLVGLGQGSEIQFGARAGQRYEIAVDGFHGAIGSFRLRWDFINTTSAPPIIVSTPADAALKLGDNVTLTVNMVAGPDTQ